MLSDFIKENPNNIVSWLDNGDTTDGEFVFSFDDGATQFNLFRDYPWKLSQEQIEIFNRENPYWAEFFKPRLEQLQVN